MLPLERTPRAELRPPAAPERPGATPPRHRTSRGTHRGPGRIALAGCALGVFFFCGACAARAVRRLPKATLVYRHERDARANDHRVELWLSYSPAPREALGSLGAEPYRAALDPCPAAPYCEVRDLLVEEAERRFLWFDPALEDPHLEWRLDDSMTSPGVDPTWRADPTLSPSQETPSTAEDETPEAAPAMEGP